LVFRPIFFLFWTFLTCCCPLGNRDVPDDRNYRDQVIHIDYIDEMEVLAAENQAQGSGMFFSMRRQGTIADVVRDTRAQDLNLARSGIYSKKGVTAREKLALALRS